MSRLPRARLFDGTSPALWILYTDTFTMAVGFYMLVPLLAYHFLQNLGLTIAVVGAIAAVRTASQNGMMPVAGWIADRIDYKRAIALGVLIRAVGFAALGSVDSVGLLIAASVLAGLGGALFHPASYAAYSALAAGRDTIRVYSTRELVSNLGFIVGPMLGGLLAGLDFRLVSWVSAGLFLAAFVVTVVGLPAGMSTGGSVQQLGFRAVLRNGAFLRYCLLAAGLSVLVSQLYLVVPIRAAEVLSGSVGVGVVYTAAAVLMVSTMLPLTGLASRTLAPRSILAVGAFCMGSGIAIMGLWPTLAGLLTGVGVFTVGQMLSQPVANAVVADFSLGSSVASYFGVLGLAHAVGGVIGSSGGGALYSLIENGGPLSQVPWWVFLGWGALVAVAFRLLGPRPLARPTERDPS